MASLDWFTLYFFLSVVLCSAEGLRESVNGFTCLPDVFVLSLIVLNFILFLLVYNIFCGPYGSKNLLEPTTALDCKMLLTSVVFCFVEVNAFSLVCMSFS